MSGQNYVQSPSRNSVTRLRYAGWIEAISFVLLVGIAMPLKYYWGNPQAVQIVGLIHGLLFILVCAALAHVMITARWSLRRGASIFVMALLPFGPFLIDSKLRRFEAEANYP